MGCTAEMRSVYDTARHALLRALRLVAPRYGLRSDDVIVAAFPKSGSTWLRFIVANIVSLLELDGRVVDYHLLNGALACEFDTLRLPTLGYSAMPRFMKTHRLYDERFFGHHRSILLVRHPGDVMVSFFEYSARLRGPGRYTGSLSDFLRHPRRGLQAWLEHTRSWMERARAVVRYEELGSKPISTVRRILDTAGVAVPDEIIVSATERADFKRIRRMEEERGLDARARAHLEEGFRFARRGVVGEWKDRLSLADVEWATRAVEGAAGYSWDRVERRR